MSAQRLRSTPHRPRCEASRPSRRSYPVHAYDVPPRPTSLSQIARAAAIAGRHANVSRSGVAWKGCKLVISGRNACDRNARDDHDRLRQRIFVRQREIDLRRHAGGRDLLQTGQRSAGERHGGLATAHVDHAHVAPEHAAAQAGAQRLRARFLGGKTLGVACGAGGAALRALLLHIGEDALDEAIAESLERLLDAADVAEIVADAQDHAVALRASSMRRLISRIAAYRPTKIASPNRKWPILSSRTSGIAAIGPTSA